MTLFTNRNIGIIALVAVLALSVILISVINEPFNPKRGRDPRTGMYINPRRGRDPSTGMYINPRRLFCGKNKLLGETQSQYQKRMSACGNLQRLPGWITPTPYSREIELPEEERSVSDLPPPPGSSQNQGERCVSECYNGFPSVVCRDTNTEEVLSRTSATVRDMSCCVNVCNSRNTWRTVCGPDYVNDTTIPCYEDEPNKF